MPKRGDVYAQIAALKAKHGRDRSLARSFPDLSTKPGYASLSDGFAPIIDNRAKTLADRFRGETKATADAIEAKANRIRPHYIKGGYQYSSDGDSAVGVYRKGG